jgi:hypothetical protein
MKYVLMFTDCPDLQAAVPPERAGQVYGQIFEWFGRNAELITDSGAELQPVTTATTVRTDPDGADPVVVDGPYTEAKEVIGGFSVIDVPDLDAAIALARTWPALGLPGVAVEIRPVVDHSGS